MACNKGLGICILLSVSLLVTSGCVERRLTVNTQPQGALVVLNDEEIGISPVTVNFNWYGDYKVRIEKEGYETLNTHRPLKAPLHDAFPLDFFASIWPQHQVDEYEWTFELNQWQAPDRQELIQNAKALRDRAITAP